MPARKAQAEIKVKGSRFVATIVPVSSKQEADEIYAALKKTFFNATHNCFAYRIERNIFRYSDDGEPSGTAGKPILQTLDRAGLVEVLCVVTRYFGGTKLGTGGLIRAYAQATDEVLNIVPLKTKLRTGVFFISLNYSQENTLRKILAAVGGRIQNSDYAAEIRMKVAVPLSKSALFAKTLTEATHSTVQIKRQ